MAKPTTTPSTTTSCLEKHTHKSFSRKRAVARDTHSHKQARKNLYKNRLVVVAQFCEKDARYLRQDSRREKKFQRDSYLNTIRQHYLDQHKQTNKHNDLCAFRSGA